MNLFMIFFSCFIQDVLLFLYLHTLIFFYFRIVAPVFINVEHFTRPSLLLTWVWNPWFFVKKRRSPKPQVSIFLMNRKRPKQPKNGRNGKKDLWFYVKNWLQSESCHLNRHFTYLTFSVQTIRLKIHLEFYIPLIPPFDLTR